MIKSTKWVISALALASFALPIQASTISTNNATNPQESSKTIFALVNDSPIYEAQLESRVQAGIDKYKRFNKGKQPADLKQKIQKEILEQYIIVELIYQASKQEKLINIDKKIAKEITKQQAKDNSKKINKTIIERQVRIDEYLKKHDLMDPKLSDKELKVFYEKNKNSFASKKDRVHVQHIIVKKDKDKIIKARKLIVDGKPFSEVAKEFSEDANAFSGGDLGFIEPKYMPKEFDDVAFSIDENKLSDIIKTSHGYHILEVLGKKPKGQVPSFEDSKDFLSRGLSPQFKAKKVAAHVNKLKEKANIKILFSPSATKAPSN